MAGLLKQISRQQKSRESTERQAVVKPSLEPVLETGAEADFFLQSSPESYETVLDTLSLNKEKEREQEREQENPKKIVSSLLLNQAAKDAPWWLSEKEESNPQVESMAQVALGEIDLERFIATDEIARKLIIQEAITQASERIKTEVRVTRKVLEQAEAELRALLLAKGPLQPLFEDPQVRAIYVDSPTSVKALRAGHLIDTPFSFYDQQQYHAFLSAIFEDSAVVNSDAAVEKVLNDKWNTRLSLLPSNLAGATDLKLVLRVPRLQAVSFYDVLQTKTLPATVAAWLAELVSTAEANILVVGPRESGKTVMGSALLSSAGSEERVLCIEEIPEIAVSNLGLERLQVVPGSDLKSLLALTPARAPHRLVLGDLRASVFADYLGLIESGYSGSLACFVAESAEDAVWRLVDALSANSFAPTESVLRRVRRACQLIVVVRRIEGVPCLTELAEVEVQAERGLVIHTLVSYLGKAAGKRMWQLGERNSFWLNRLKERGLNLMPGAGLLGPEQKLPQSGSNKTEDLGAL